MREPRTRREFLADVGTGALLATVGLGAARTLGLSAAFADAAPPPLTFGSMEPLVALMQETSVEKLLPLLVERLRAGTELRTLVAAGALANARTFGGEDYVGFHTMMAIGPAYQMALDSPEARRALPVLKVLVRNSSRIQEVGGRAKEILHEVEPGTLPAVRDQGMALREQVRGKDLDAAEKTFAALSRGPIDTALNALLTEVEDGTEVHRVVLPFRAFELAGIIGAEHAHTLLRQSVRYCVKEESRSGGSGGPSIRTVLPAALEDHHLLSPTLGTRTADDGWIDFTSQSVLSGTPEEAAEIAAAALAEGFAPAAIGEAIALAANQLLLRDIGRTARDEKPGKPVGSVHGDSIGVHACDSANAWRHLALASRPRNTAACLIAGAFQVARDRVGRGGDFLHWQPRPLAEDVEKVTVTDADALLREAAAAIEAKDQARASAVVQRYGTLGHAPRPLFDVMLRYATSEDGALHAEKYYRTATDEFASTRAAFRWRHAVALARVTASEFGTRAAGYEEACHLLGV
jgi:hypothetical protein